MQITRYNINEVNYRKQFLVRLAFKASGFAAILDVTICGLVLAGYAFGWRWAWRPIEHGRAFHPAGAGCLLALGLAAWLLRPGRRSWPSLMIAVAVAAISLLLIGYVLTGHATDINAYSPFGHVLAVEAAAGRPVEIRLLASATFLLLSTSLILRHCGQSSAAQLVAGVASVAPLGAVLGYVYGVSGSDTVTTPAAAAASLCAAWAIAGRMAHKVPLRSVLTLNVPGHAIRVQIAMLVGFSLFLSIVVARFEWEGDIRTFGIEVAALVVIILLTLGNAGYRWQQGQQRQVMSRRRSRFPLAADLNRAWERGEIFLLYQPQVRFADTRLTGVEALARWRHPELGLVSPDKFIPAAEGTGLIEPLGLWIFQTACEQAARWQHTHLAGVSVAINVSAVQLSQEGCAARLIALQRRSSVPADRIVIEVTESTLIERGGRALTELRQLREAGMFVAIDDFGEGFSSLSSLRSLPSQLLKIDKSFVREIPTNPTACMIIRAVIGMGSGLGMRIIAEGVETAEQAAFLKQFGCDKAQGYLYGRPMPAAELERISLQSPNHWPTL